VSLLEARGLSKHFGGVQAVAALDLDVAEGEVVGLIGPNGAGKTTVFNLLSGFLAPDASSTGSGSAARRPRSPPASPWPSASASSSRARWPPSRRCSCWTR
jgi:ABC-type multidrug transport system ATPase subunit